MNKQAINDEQEQKKSLRRSWKSSGPIAKLGVVFAGIAAVATVIYALITGSQLFVMSRQLTALTESNRINREALVSVQRAFITYQQVVPERSREGPQGKHYWAVAPLIENVGTTPAVSVIHFWGLDYLPNEPDEKTFKGDHTKFQAITVGSKATQPLTPYTKYESFLFGNDLGDDLGNFTKWATPNKWQLFIWGWVGYRDVFSSTKPHITEFCGKLMSIDINPVAKTLKWQMMNCDTHNCTDEYCKDYDSIAELVPKI